MEYAAWRISFQSSEQAARAAYQQLTKKKLIAHQLVDTVEQLTDRVRELEKENAELHEQVDMQIPKLAFAQLQEKLAASQAYAERLREALVVLDGVSDIGCSQVYEALALPRDTSALDAYVAAKVKKHDSRHVPEAMKGLGI